MNFLLDMKTILITLVVGHLFSVVLISSYWKSHKRESTLNTFLLAKCFSALAWLLLALQGGIHDLFTISISNSLLYIGAALEAVSILKLVSHFQPITKKLYIILLIANLVGFHLVLFYYNFENVRISLASIGTAIFVILPAIRLLHGKNSSLLMRIMGFFYCLVTVFLFIRGIAALTSEKEFGIFTPGLIQTFSFLSLYLVMFLGNTGFILILKEKADDELIRMAYYDDLTHILNRRTFVLKAKELLAQCVKEGKFLSFILLDIDNFKKFNDHYGHDAGDRILQDLSQRVNQSLDSKSLFGRYGGDEFAILLTGLNQNESVKVLEKIAELVDQAEIEGVLEKYTISFGVITLIPTKQTELDNLYVCSDKALYQAKHNGRNCICCGDMKDTDENEKTGMSIVTT